jgi:hypothetical protein
MWCAWWCHPGMNSICWVVVALCRQLWFDRVRSVRVDVVGVCWGMCTCLWSLLHHVVRLACLGGEFLFPHFLPMSIIGYDRCIVPLPFPLLLIPWLQPSLVSPVVVMAIWQVRWVRRTPFSLQACKCIGLTTVLHTLLALEQVVPYTTTHGRPMLGVCMIGVS